MSRLRWTLVALLVASTALFAIGVSAERSDADTHVRKPRRPKRPVASPGSAHDEAGETGEAEAEEAHAEPARARRTPRTSGCWASTWSPRR